MLSRLFKPLALPPQLTWCYAHEPAVMEWTIRARNYNVFAANVACVILGVIFFVFLYAMRRENESILSLAVMYFLGMGFASAMFHPRMNTAYRLTQSGIEHCEWKDYPRWMLKCLNWFMGISAVVCVFLASIDPAFLLGALVGPGGMGLMYWAVANSKSHQKLYTHYHYYAYRWEEITQIAVATNREVVDLRYDVLEEGDPISITGSLNIFCRSKGKYKLAELIKPYLRDGVPFVVTKVNVPMSTN